MNIRSILSAVVIPIVFTVGGSVLAQEFELPDSEVNPQSQDIEIAAPVWAGSNQDIKYVIDRDPGPEVFSLTENAADDLRPRVTIASSGDAWVTWWRDEAVDSVVVRKRNFADDTWDGERVISDPVENSRNPVIVHHGADAWVAYEFEQSGETGIGVLIVIDEPDPIGIRDELGMTDHDGPIDLAIHSDQGQLWVTWIDGDTEVGWAGYNAQSAAWSLPSYESYAADSVGDARDRIRNAALGQ